MRSLIAFLGLLSFCCSSGVTKDDHTDMGEISEQLKEASGLVASVANKGCLWTINDGGNPAEVFLIDSVAQTKMSCELTNIQNRDWEDISIGRGPDSTKKYIYIADIGDNLEHYDFKYIYRFPEPELKNGAHQVITDAEKLTIALPDGKRDAETMMIDPVTNDLYIVSKREENVSLYVSRYPFQSDTLKMEKAMTLPFTLIVSGSISFDGQHVLLKSYKRIFYWKRAGEMSLLELLSTKPKKIPYETENQGEAICWNLSATGFYTISESPIIGPRSQLRFYKMK